MMSVHMPPRPDGMINVTREEVQDALAATEDVELVRADGTLTDAGQLYVADVRREAIRERFNPEFDHVYLIDGLGTITDADGIHEPDVWNHPTDDVYVAGDGWSVLTGHTGQYGYNGAVMHASEQWGLWATDDLMSRVEEDGWVAFCVVEVRDEDGSLPDGDPIGWAVAWKVIRD